MALLLSVVFCAWAYAYSARDALSETRQGRQPGADPGPAFAASEKLTLTKTAAGARVTLNWVYAEENYVTISYQVEDLKEGRRVDGHPAELQPILVFGKPSPREEVYLEEHGLGTEGVNLTDESHTDFRMVDNFGETAYGPNHVTKRPLQNGVAFKPEEGLEPSKEHEFRLEVPLYESAVVPLGQRPPPPEPFPGEPFVFEFEVPVHAVPVVEVDEKARAKGVTLRLKRVFNSPGRPRAVICYKPPDRKHHWFIHGGKGTLLGGMSTSGWSVTGSMRAVPPAKCQRLMLKAPAEGRTSVEVAMLEGMPDCPYNLDEAAWQACMEKRYRTIRGPWRFEFKAPTLSRATYRATTYRNGGPPLPESPDRAVCIRRPGLVDGVLNPPSRCQRSGSVLRR